MLKIFNSLSKEKEEFIPINKDLIRLYRCGPTVQGKMHIGHAKTYVAFDVVRRFLIHLYGKSNVLYVMNITDVGHLAGDSDDGEDKLEGQALKENISPFEVAAKYEELFLNDMDKLNIMKPDRLPHASQFVRQQIEMIEILISKNYAYKVDSGSVYFDITNYEINKPFNGSLPYGSLSRRLKDDQINSGRIEVRSEKKDTRDFALWKGATKEEHFMLWLSPWGWGYPGWHIECSAMSKFYLGDTFDIHIGGLDNQFPHHECEIAQSQAANGKPFVNYWMHNNMLNNSGQKMSKSLGNMTDMDDLYKLIDPIAIRFLIQSHYRSQSEYSFEALEASQKGLLKLKNVLVRLKYLVGEVSEVDFNDLDFIKEFIEFMNDDFNTPNAIASLFKGITDLHKLLDQKKIDIDLLKKYYSGFKFSFGDILGLDIFNSIKIESDVTEKLMKLIFDIRKTAKVNKDYSTSDLIRDELKNAGIDIQDTKDGPRWNIN